MSDLKKVLTLVACGCICLMVATSVSADYQGVKTVNKDSQEGGEDSENFLCTLGNGAFVPDDGVTVCNISAIFDNGVDRLLSVGKNPEIRITVSLIFCALGQ